MGSSEQGNQPRSTDKSWVTEDLWSFEEQLSSLELVSYPEQHDQAVVCVRTELSIHAHLHQHTHLIIHFLVTYSVTHLHMVQSPNYLVPSLYHLWKQ